MKTYENFKDIAGNSYKFSNYMDFATWFFGIPHRRMVTAFDRVTFKKLNYAATKSAEAREKKY